MKSAKTTFAVLILMPLCSASFSYEMYRHIDSNGQASISSQLSKEAIINGYDIIDRSGRFVRSVPRSMTDEEREHHAKKKKQEIEDKKILTLYPTSFDAKRAMERQKESALLLISSSRVIILQTTSKLDSEVESAASHERSGKPIPENILHSISNYESQIDIEEEKIKQMEEKLTDIENSFMPIITRLIEIESGQ